MTQTLNAIGTWVYFLHGMEPASKDVYQESYKILEVKPVRGESRVRIWQGEEMTRLESPLPKTFAPGKVKFKAAVRHLQYTDAGTRADLRKESAPPFAADESVLAVLIPIRKSEQWWALAQDERQEYFQPKDAARRHTAIGRDYAGRVYRKLYHARYLEEQPPLDYDFLTYFEFARKDRSLFEDLLGELRDIKINPEWAFVDFEMEIWLAKKEKRLS